MKTISTITSIIWLMFVLLLAIDLYELDADLIMSVMVILLITSALFQSVAYLTNKGKN